MSFVVQRLVLPNGNVPFDDWFESLNDAKARARVDARLARVRAGNLGDHKALGEGVFELRIDWGPGLRIYFGRRGQEFIALLGGGDKSTQSRDIRRAQQLWREYANEVS
ncbi:MAG: type II toxin-antitoxin system RelE/ParE family toxin [Verrucomicrobia bacterium]|nr:type II toxin-antitoxin system RelE/ParE family toxin [Verrucomicrobiota bacterium]